MLIRKMVKADAAAYRELRLRALQLHPEAYGSSYEENLERDIEFFRERIPEPDSDDAIFTAEEAGQLLGMVSFVRDTQQKLKHRANIYGVYVDASVRGRGIGRLLMQYTIDYASQLEGVRQLVLGVATTNAVAFSLYQSLGFTIWGTEPDVLFVNGRYHDEHNMILFMNKGKT